MSTWKVYLAAAIAVALSHGSGLVGDYGLILLSVATPIAVVMGIRRYRPDPPGPWLLLIAAAVAWSISGAVDTATGAPGDLTAGRHMLPDVFALAGYALFALALITMLRAQGQTTRSRSLMLDSVVLALSLLLICWITLVAPVLYHLDAAGTAKFSIIVYVPISALLVIIAARLAFGTANPGASQRLLLAGMVMLQTGDAALVPLEAGLFDVVPGRLLEVPYALAYSFVGAAALHPSMVDTVRHHLAEPRPDERRFALVAAALVIPALIVLVWSPNTLLERVIVGLLTLALAISAILRVIWAARTQAVVEDRLALQATTDQLTGLTNRPAAHDLVNRHLEDTRAVSDSLALLFVDLDRFKLVNDSYGHAVGDELLLAAAERLQAGVGPDDTVARLSGDEFLVVMPSADLARVEEVATHICDVFAEPFELIGTAWVTASVGVAVATTATTTDAGALIRDADTAMYEAKAAGRGGFMMFDPSMRAKSERQLELYNGLHLAVERDEFEVHYQAIVEATSGVVHGVEALVRWQSPTGMVMPDQFISLAEDSGLIAPIGEIVLNRACDQVARWRQLPECADLTLSVNVSARQIIDADLVAVVQHALAASGLEPDALWLEITESVMMVDTLDTAATLSAIRAIGVHLSVDDFGTGNSSLSYLQRFPVEQVKIDRQFVMGMLEHSEDAAVVAAVLGIADALGLSLIAEGVETPEQAQRLVDLGCKLFQGYLYSRPVSAIDLGPILVERNQFQSPPSAGTISR